MSVCRLRVQVTKTPQAIGRIVTGTLLIDTQMSLLGGGRTSRSGVARVHLNGSAGQFLPHANFPSSFFGMVSFTILFNFCSLFIITDVSRVCHCSPNVHSMRSANSLVRTSKGSIARGRFYGVLVQCALSVAGMKLLRHHRLTAERLTACAYVSGR